MAWYIYVRNSAPKGCVPQSWGPYPSREAAEAERLQIIRDKPDTLKKRTAESLYVRED